jgi:DNA-directed RNA polymerase beta' subunit
MLASFEETNEHLFEAAAHNREDKIRGVSECIIMGKSIGLGTGSFDLLYNYSHHLTQSISQSLSFHQTSNTYPNSCSSTSSRAALLLSKYTKTTTPISPAVIS